jgi:LuxR family transcriptional regulator
MASYVRRHDHSDRDRLLKELRSVGSGSARGEHPLVSNLRKLVAFEHFTFSGLDLDGFRVGRGAHLATNMPERFLRGYLSRACIDVDPLMRRSTEASPLAVWDSVSEHELRDPAVRPLNELLRDCEIADRAGLSFWRDGRAFGVAVFTRPRGFTEAELATLTAFAGPIHDVFAQAAMEHLNGMLAISPGELRCLEWAAKGLTSEEIARETRYAPDTVTTYLKSAIKKLGASNRTQAVAEAIRRRIIH